MEVTNKNSMPSDAHNSNNGTEDAPIYCICRSTAYDYDFMIQCDFCDKWYHGKCIGITKEESKFIDKFCCNECKIKNAALETTYKTDNARNKVQQHSRKSYKRRKVPVSMEWQETPDTVEVTFNQNSTDSVNNSETATTIGLSTATSSSCFDFVDTTVRKAKTKAYDKFKFSSSVPKPKEELKTTQTELRQCYGPGCTKVARKGSKYCSDTCGEALASNRILEILPQRIQQRNNTSCAADEISQQKLNNIRKEISKVKNQLEEVDIEIIRMIHKVIESKQPGKNFVELQCDDTSPIDCVLCGVETTNKAVEKHMEQCYRKLEKKIYITEHTAKPNDAKWNIFCNHKLSKNVYCKKMRVMCSAHYKDTRSDDEVCGFNLGEKDGVVRYCGNIGRTCNHVNWEEILRAELDLKKLNLLLKINSLKDEEDRIRVEMARRNDLLSLMMNNTIEH